MIPRIGDVFTTARTGNLMANLNFPGGRVTDLFFRRVAQAIWPNSRSGEFGPVEKIDELTISPETVLTDGQYAYLQINAILDYIKKRHNMFIMFQRVFSYNGNTKLMDSLKQKFPLAIIDYFMSDPKLYFMNWELMLNSVWPLGILDKDRRIPIPRKYMIWHALAVAKYCPDLKQYTINHSGYANLAFSFAVGEYISDDGIFVTNTEVSDEYRGQFEKIYDYMVNDPDLCLNSIVFNNFKKESEKTRVMMFLQTWINNVGIDAAQTKNVHYNPNEGRKNMFKGLFCSYYKHICKNTAEFSNEFAHRLQNPPKYVVLDERAQQVNLARANETSATDRIVRITAEIEQTQSAQKLTAERANALAARRIEIMARIQELYDLTRSKILKSYNDYHSDYIEKRDAFITMMNPSDPVAAADAYDKTHLKPIDWTPLKKFERILSNTKHALEEGEITTTFVPPAKIAKTTAQ